MIRARRPWMDLPEAELGRGLDHELASVKAALAEGPQRIVDRGRDRQFLAQRDGVLQAHRASGGQVGRRGVRGIANNDRPAPVPRVWRHDGFEARVVNLGRLADLLAEFRGHAAERLELKPIVAPDPWYRGRAIVIGDAAHATT